MDPKVDAKKAIDNTEEFLKDYHDSRRLVSATLEDDVWIVVFDVGFLSKDMKEIKVDAKSGKILGYVNAGKN